MKIYFGASDAITDKEANLITYFKTFLYWQPEGYYFSEAYKKGHWDGKYYLFKVTKDGVRFPTGLLSFVAGKLRAKGYDLEIIDVRKKEFETKDLVWVGKELRDYQLDALNKAVESSRGIWANATGSGKMLLAASLVQSIGVKTIVTVLTKEALNDTYNEFKDSISGCDIGRWGGGHKDIQWITITTHASFAQCVKKENALFDFWKDANMIVFDEAHYLGADSYYNALHKSKAYYKIGMTGTPFRGDNKDLKLFAATGKIIYELPLVDLQEKGFAVETEVMFVRTKRPEHISSLEFMRLSADERYSEGIVRNIGRNKLAIDIANKHLAECDSVLITVERAEHGNILSQMSGWAYVDGSSSMADREFYQKEFVDGNIKVLIASRIYNQSANIPILSVLINLAGFSPRAAMVQKLGRIVRKVDGKEKAILYDFYDDWHSKLEAHSLKRISHLKREGHEVTILNEI